MNLRTLIRLDKRKSLNYPIIKQWYCNMGSYDNYTALIKDLDMYAKYTKMIQSRFVFILVLLILAVITIRYSYVVATITCIICALYQVVIIIQTLPLIRLHRPRPALLAKEYGDLAKQEFFRKFDVQTPPIIVSKAGEEVLRSFGQTDEAKFIGLHSVMLNFRLADNNIDVYRSKKTWI